MTTSAKPTCEMESIRYFCLHPLGHRLFFTRTNLHDVQELSLGINSAKTQVVVVASSTKQSVAGSATERGDRDGISGAARFSSPSALVLDDVGRHLFVADFWNNCVKQI